MRRLLCSLGLLAALPLAAQQSAPASEQVDLNVLNQIKAEAFQNSQVMEDIFYLTDVYGPRLTSSPNHRASAEWIMKTLKSYGLQNVHLEKWSFGQSWRLDHFSASLLEPSYSPLIGFPLAWSPGTDGVVTGEPVLAPIRSEADFEKYKGKLKGKIVLVMEPRTLELINEPQAHRWTQEELNARTVTPDPSRLNSFGGRSRTPAGPVPDRAAMLKLKSATNKFLKDEGALVVLQYGNPADGGTVFGTSAGSQDPAAPVPPPTVVLTPEHYNRIVRLVEHKIPTKLEFDIKAEFIKDDPDSFNVIGEIPGSTKKDEIVMLGGHLDSWVGGTGATDNATGSSVAIEAVRILASLKKPMARTVRIALWGGEEEGLLGSKAYVQQHFAPRDSMKQTAEYAKLDAYFNDDNGSGRFRGISAGGNLLTKQIFETWVEPLKDLEITTVAGATAPPTKEPGGTDHTSFTWIGLPGFGFIQDPLEYATRTHHSNMDVYDRVQPGDVMQGAAIEAWFVYNTATRPEMLPRLPTPSPLK